MATKHPPKTPLQSVKKFALSRLAIVALVFVVFGSFVVLQSRAATVYTVSPGQSLDAAIAKLQPGDTLIVKGGAYSGTVTASNKGTASAPITVKAAAGERPVLTGLVRLSNVSYFTWDGVNVTWPSGAASTDHMFKIMNTSDHWRITNSEIWGAHSFAGISIHNSSSAWRIDHNVIHDTYKSNGTNQDHLIYDNGGDGGGIIERNIFYTSPNGRGIKIGPPSGGSAPIGNVIIRYNNFYNNTGPANIQLSYGAKGNKIYRNIMAKSGAGKHNITNNSVNGTGNVASDNVGWDSAGVVESDATHIVDGGGNIMADPKYANLTALKPTNPAVLNYGAYAPGDTQAPPTSAPTPVPTPAPTPVPDTTKPSASITAPAPSARLSGSVALAANASDNVGVAKVEFLAGANVVGTDTTSPYSFTWNTASIANGAYALTARATDAAGNVGVSLPVSVTVANSTSDTQSPSAPSGLTSSAVSATSLTLGWTASTDNVGVTGYDVMRNGVVVGSSTSRTYNDTGLTPGSTYAYTVVALDAAGNRSLTSSSHVVTTATDSADSQAPSAPSSVAGSSPNGTSINLTWAPSSDNVGVANYLVQRDGVTIAFTTAPNFNDTDVIPGNDYTYVVLARDQANNISLPSSPVTVSTSTVADRVAPSAPQSLTASSVGSGEIDLAWGASSDNVAVAGYDVYRDGDLLERVDSTTYGDATVEAGSSHSYYVVAVDAAGNRSAASNTVNATAGTVTPGDGGGSTGGGGSAAVTSVVKVASSAAKSISIERPASVGAGMVLVASLDVRGQPTVTAPSGWNLVRKDVATAGNTMVKYTFAHTTSSGEPTSYTFKFSGSQSATAVMAAVAGVSTATPKATGKVNASSSKITAPGITPATGRSVVLGFYGLANDAKISAPSNMSELGQILSFAGSDVSSQVSIRPMSASSSTGDETASASKSAIGIGQLVVLESLQP